LDAPRGLSSSEKSEALDIVVVKNRKDVGAGKELCSRARRLRELPA
jgi:hypothetical protein